VVIFLVSCMLTGSVVRGSRIWNCAYCVYTVFMKECFFHVLNMVRIVIPRVASGCLLVIMLAIGSKVRGFQFFFHVLNMVRIIIPRVASGCLLVIMLAIGSKVRGFQPGRGRWIFKGDKNPYHDFLRRGSKFLGPLS
jgi:hypothetical protein